MENKVYVLTTYEVRGPEMDTFEKEARKCSQRFNKMEGLILCELSRNVENNNEFVLIESWTDFKHFEQAQLNPDMKKSEDCLKEKCESVS